MGNPIAGKNIVLGVTGSIAAYKSADLASRLTKMQANVDVVLTEAGTEFVNPITFQSVTGRKAYVEADLWGGQGHVVHISLARKADMIVVAPASANTIAKLANGIADNLLTVTVLAATCKIIIAPAMDAGMFANASTQENVQKLEKLGFEIIGPGEGRLASGLIGKGRMEEPEIIENFIRYRFSRGNPLQGKKIVVTAGGTQEAIDPVRILTNDSSGKQGFALAQAALDAGAEVTLITGPTHLLSPTGCRTVRVKSASDMQAAVLGEITDADALIMAAAVADFRPKEESASKIKKSNGQEKIELVRTRDILKDVAAYKKENKKDLKVVGFAAESNDLKENARVKMQDKKMDMIVANDISDPEAGFGVDTNKVLLMYSDGSVEDLPSMPKYEVAEKVIQHLQSWLTEGTR